MTDALIERIQQNSVEEDWVWSKMSEEAKKEGVLSFEESESLLTRMKNA